MKSVVAKLLRLGGELAMRHSWLRRPAMRVLALSPSLRTRLLCLAFAPAPKPESTAGDSIAMRTLGTEGQRIYRRLRSATEHRVG